MSVIPLNPNQTKSFDKRLDDVEADMLTLQEDYNNSKADYGPYDERLKTAEENSSNALDAATKANERVNNIVNAPTGKDLEVQDLKYDAVNNVQYSSAGERLNAVSSSLKYKSQQYYVDIKMFGAKGDGVTDDTSAIQNAINYAYQKYLTTSLAGSVIFPCGTYKITSTIDISPIIKIITQGNVVILDYIADNSNAIQIKSKSTDPDFGRNYYLSPILNNNIGTLSINSKRNNKTGIGIYVSSIANKTVNLEANGIYVSGYNIGAQFDSYNLYLAFCKKIFTEGNIIGLQIGNNTGENQNSGENLNFDSCFFSLNDCAVKITNSNPVKFYNCSFDGNYCVLYLTSNNLGIIFDKCWIEATGYNSATQLNGNYNGFDGIVKAYNSSNWYDKTFITMRDSRIVFSTGDYPKSHLFEGTSLVLTLDNLQLDYSESFWKSQSINEKDNLFFVDNNIRGLNVISCCHNVTSAPLIQSNLSVIDPYFANENDRVITSSGGTVTTPASIGDYDIIASQGIGKCEVVTIDNMKCIGLLTRWAGDTTSLTLRSKRKYFLKGNSFEATTLIKGYTSGVNSIAYLSLEFYDSNDTLLLTNEIQNTFRTDETGTANNVWIFPYSSKAGIIDIPKGTSYYKIKVILKSNNGSANTGEVYFTGIHVSNY